MLHPPLCPGGRGAVVYIDWCITETCSRQEAIGHEVEQLMNALRQLLMGLESLYCHNNEESEYDTNITSSNDGSPLVE